MPPDPQTLLQQPMWTTTMQFLHTPSSNTNSAFTDLLATGTAYKQVQIYDVRSSSTTRRPVLYTPERLLDHRITALCQLRDGNTLAVGDSAGDCHLLDMRKMHSGKSTSAKFKHAKEDIGLGRLVGPGGSIRRLEMHPTLPHLACVGLDRKMWTWDVSRRKMMDCVYLKQRLNCLLFCEDESWAGGDDEEEDEEEVQDDGDVVAGTKRERDLEDDAVEDYVNSDDEVDDDVANKIDSKQKESRSNSEETESESEEEGSEEGEEPEEESSSNEEEEPVVPAANTKKRRKSKH